MASLLQHIFFNKKKGAETLDMDNDKRYKLWQEHLANFKQRYAKVQVFSPASINKTMADRELVMRTLHELSELVPKDLVNIDSEETIEAEIIHLLKKFTDQHNFAETYRLNSETYDESKREEAVMAILEKSYNILRTLLHSIRVCEKNLSDKELLQSLYKLIDHHEDCLYAKFYETERVKPIFAEVHKIAKAILLEEKFERAVKTDEDVFVASITKVLGRGVSEHGIRKLAEEIFTEVVTMAAKSVPEDTDPEKAFDLGIAEMEKVMKNDSIMMDILLQLRPKQSEEKSRLIMLAFRQAYDMGHLFDMIQTLS